MSITCAKHVDGTYASNSNTQLILPLDYPKLGIGEKCVSEVLEKLIHIYAFDRKGVYFLSHFLAIPVFKV